MHRRISLTSSQFKNAISSTNMVTFIQKNTYHQWNKMPSNITTIFSDALRLRIKGVTKKTALYLLIPQNVLDTMRYFPTQISRWCTANVYSLESVLHTINNIYPDVDMYEKAIEEKKQKSLNRIQRAQIRYSREKEIYKILQEEGVPKTHTPDPKLVKLYISNGSIKNLNKIQQEAKQAILIEGRSKQVDSLIESKELMKKSIPWHARNSSISTGDKD